MKRIFSLLLIAFSLMHLLAFTISLIRLQIIKSQSLILGVIFLVLGIILHQRGVKAKG